MTVHKVRQLDDGSLMDLATGEILGGQANRGTFVFIPSKPKIKESWFMFFQSACEKLSKDKTLSGETFRVLMKLLSDLDFENYILIPQSEVAKELDMQRSHVNRAIKQLLDKGIIVRGAKLGRTYSYKLNSAYGWKGKVVNFYKEDEADSPKAKLVVDNTKNFENHPS